jgi:hypothetical protein
MNKKEFLEQIRKIENNYKYTFSQEQLKLWWNEFSTLNLETFTRAINKIIQTINTIPKIADIKSNISTSRMNLDSSFWYENFKDIRPCFNIKTGELLEPYN